LSDLHGYLIFYIFIQRYPLQDNPLSYRKIQINFFAGVGNKIQVTSFKLTAATLSSGVSTVVL